MLSVYSDSCRHAMRALLHLGRLGTGVRVSAAALGAADDLPEAALAKVLQRLAAAGILDSARGPGGGFALARPAAAIRLLDVVQAVDGEARARECALGRESCTESSWCPIHNHWFKARTMLSEMLRTTTVADLLRRGPKRAGARARAAALAGARGSRTRPATTAVRGGRT